MNSRSQVRKCLEEFNEKISTAYENDNAFLLQITGKPKFWIDDADRIHKFRSVFARAPLVAGQLAVIGFIGRISESGTFLPYAVGEIENLDLPVLGFKIADIAIMQSAAEHVDFDYDFYR